MTVCAEDVTVDMCCAMSLTYILNTYIAIISGKSRAISLPVSLLTYRQTPTNPHFFSTCDVPSTFADSKPVKFSFENVTFQPIKNRCEFKSIKKLFQTIAT